MHVRRSSLNLMLFVMTFTFYCIIMCLVENFLYVFDKYKTFKEIKVLLCFERLFKAISIYTLTFFKASLKSAGTYYSKSPPRGKVLVAFEMEMWKFCLQKIEELVNESSCEVF